MRIRWFRVLAASSTLAVGVLLAPLLVLRLTVPDAPPPTRVFAGPDACATGDFVRLAVEAAGAFGPEVGEIGLRAAGRCARASDLPAAAWMDWFFASQEVLSVERDASAAPAERVALALDLAELAWDQGNASGVSQLGVALAVVDLALDVVERNARYLPPDPVVAARLERLSTLQVDAAAVAIRDEHITWRTLSSLPPTWWGCVPRVTLGLARVRLSLPGLRQGELGWLPETPEQSYEGVLPYVLRSAQEAQARAHVLAGVIGGPS